MLMDDHCCTIEEGSKKLHFSGSCIYALLKSEELPIGLEHFNS